MAMSSKAISAQALGGEADTIAVASSLQPLDANVLASSTKAAAPDSTATTMMPTATPSLSASAANAKSGQQAPPAASDSSSSLPTASQTNENVAPGSATTTAAASGPGSDRAAIGLHSPPDSNNASKLDGSSDSELSDLDDDALAETFRGLQPEDVDATLTSVTTPTAAAADTVYAASAAASDAAPAADAQCSSTTPTSDDKPSSADAPAAAAEEEDDIGEVEPDHYSGTVPVFRPTMHQFRDFKKFVRSIPPRCFMAYLSFMLALPYQSLSHAHAILSLSLDLSSCVSMALSLGMPCLPVLPLCIQ